MIVIINISKHQCHLFQQIIFLNKPKTLSVSLESTASSAFLTDAFARCNSSFSETADIGSMKLSVPDALTRKKEYMSIRL